MQVVPFGAVSVRSGLQKSSTFPGQRQNLSKVALSDSFTPAFGMADTMSLHILQQLVADPQTSAKDMHDRLYAYRNQQQQETEPAVLIRAYSALIAIAFEIAERPDELISGVGEGFINHNLQNFEDYCSTHLINVSTGELEDESVQDALAFLVQYGSSKATVDSIASALDSAIRNKDRKLVQQYHTALKDLSKRQVPHAETAIINRIKQIRGFLPQQT